MCIEFRSLCCLFPGRSLSQNVAVWCRCTTTRRWLSLKGPAHTALLTTIPFGLLMRKVGSSHPRNTSTTRWHSRCSARRLKAITHVCLRMARRGVANHTGGDIWWEVEVLHNVVALLMLFIHVIIKFNLFAAWLQNSKCNRHDQIFS